MTEIVMSWPWYDRAIFGVIVAGVAFAPWQLSKQLGHLYTQNERIIGLLIDIKMARK